MHAIRPEDIKRCSDPGSFARGVKYFSDGRVLSLDVGAGADAGGDFLVRATVAGSEGQIYEQEVEIHRLHGRHADILGECTCPVGYNCKHVVAACLQFNKWRQQPEKSSQNYWREWLQRFAAPAPASNPMLEGAEFIAYVLTEAAHHSGVSLSVLQTRPLQRGGFSKGKPLDIANLFYDHRRLRCATPQDVLLVELMMPLCHTHVDGVTLHGELGFLVLRRMLATARCFWGEVSAQPLRPAAERVARLLWEPTKDDKQRLALQVEPAAILLPTIPTTYVDPYQLVCGSVSNAQFSEDQWHLLERMPIVPADEVEEFSRKLLIAVPDAPLLVPSQVQVLQVTGPAIPCVYLEGGGAGAGNARFMRLCFDYQSLEIPLWPAEERTVREQGAAIVTVQRDLAAEKAALERLLAAGFRLHQDTDASVLLLPSAGSELGAAQCWHDFQQQEVAHLRAAGWRVQVTDDFDFRVHDATDWDVSVDDHNEWFDLRFDLEVDGRKLPLLPIISQLLARYEPDELPAQVMVSLEGGGYLRLPGDRMRSMCRILYELHDGVLSPTEDHLVLHRHDAARLSELHATLDTNRPWHGGERLLQLGQELSDFAGIATVPPPAALQTTLRQYQQVGLNWLQFLRRYGFGGILADDMGLGKTVQTLAHLLVEKEQGRLDRPCLIVAPTSLMGNWRREARQFAPALSVLVLQGTHRQQDYARIAAHDLVLTTYPLVVRDAQVLAAGNYHYLILDEAQYIKNPKSKSARVVRDIDARHRLCLTGTPMENHLGELWAQFDFLMPGLLGRDSDFVRRFRTPIERHGDGLRREQLARKVAPFMLRRTKAQVVTELPPKTEMLRSVVLGSKQAGLYESIRLAMEKKVRQAIASKGLARSHIMVLDALLKLRQTCCDPGLLALEEAAQVQESAKLEMLMELLPALLEEGRRVLLFSQFTRMLTIIEKQLQGQGISYVKLTGQTRDRDAVIDRFKSGEVPLFLISLKAGGVGLNLTEADAVIHYDPWWNPAAENQATDRAYRIGQDKPVFVYKLITENTVEEKILLMQERKQNLAQGIYRDKSTTGDFPFSAEDLVDLFT